jgi:hypothetical protein
MSFTDLHAMMAFAATDRQTEAKAHIAVLESAATANTDTGRIIQQAGLPLVRGFEAFGRGDYGAAKRHIGNARHNSHMIGGSIAQRDVINWTLIEAAIRDDDAAMATALLAERTLTKPHSPLTDMFARRAA